MGAKEKKLCEGRAEALIAVRFWWQLIYRDSVEDLARKKRSRSASKTTPKRPQNHPIVSPVRLSCFLVALVTGHSRTDT
jgi:hypothetical protein